MSDHHNRKYAPSVMAECFANLLCRVAFYYPMLAIINLFIYIIKYPSLTTTTSDLAFLDIGSGHFGHIHQLTSSQVSFRFPREAVALADKAMKRASAHVPIPTMETTQATSPADTCNDIPAVWLSLLSMGACYCATLHPCC